MNNKFFIKQGDLMPGLQAYLSHRNTGPIELQAGDIIKFIMTPRNNRQEIIIEKLATIIDEEQGLVQYEWEQGDTDIAGEYQGEFLLLLNGTVPIRFPNNGYFHIVIDHKLG